MTQHERNILARWLLFNDAELERIKNALSDPSVTSPGSAKLYEEACKAQMLRARL